MVYKKYLGRLKTISKVKKKHNKSVKTLLGSTVYIKSKKFLGNTKWATKYKQTNYYVKKTQEIQNTRKARNVDFQNISAYVDIFIFLFIYLSQTQGP